MIIKYLKKRVNIDEIKIAAIISYITIFFNILSGLLYTPWMINQIGTADYGLYTLSTSLISIFVVDFGLGAAISRFISKYRAEGNEKKISQFLGIIYRMYLIISIIIFIILIIVFFYIDNIFVSLSSDELTKFKVIYCISGIFSMVSFPFTPLNGIIISHEKFIFHKGLDLIQKVLVVLMMAVALLLGYGLYALVLVNALVGIILIAIKIFYLNKYHPYKIEFNYRNKEIVRSIFSFSIWTTMVLIGQRLILNITPSILGITSGATDISIFSIGVTIEGYVYTISTAFSGMFLPKVTNIIYGNNNNENIDELMIRIGRIQLIIVGAIITVFFVTGKKFIFLWMGKEFNDAYIISLLLIFNFIVIVTQEIGNTMLIATNKIKYDAISVVITGLISISLSFIFSKYLGAKGAALAIFIGNFIGRVLIKNIIFKKILKINIKKFFVECHLSMIGPLILTVIVGLIISNIFNSQTWLNFIFEGFIMTISYCGFIWFLGLNKLEKEMIKNLIK